MRRLLVFSAILLPVLLLRDSCNDSLELACVAHRLGNVLMDVAAVAVAVVFGMLFGVLYIFGLLEGAEPPPQVK